MAHDPLACGDLIAERRFAYAKAAAEDGDWSAAAEIFEQALERAPHWAAAWFALGEAREKLGDVEGAADAFRSALAADPSDAQGAAARLALIGRGEATRALPQAYVARLFDDYAPRFDAHLTEQFGLSRPCPHRRRAGLGARPVAGSRAPSTSAAARASWGRRCAAASTI